jgi:ABC-type nitrate/sulfonate/bicarbonate transport system ATPase subunit
MRCEVKEKRFGDALILRDVGFEIGEGEFVALAGPSGSGKTTLLRMIAGLDLDYSGSISGQESLGVVFQEPRLLPWRTVAENLRLAAPLALERDATALLTRVGLPDAGAMYPRVLSLGMARRAAIARALAVKPCLLLLDEPFVSLDRETAESLRRLLLDLWRENRFRVLMVTHDLPEARQMAQRIVHLAGKPATVAKIETVR